MSRTRSVICSCPGRDAARSSCVTLLRTTGTPVSSQATGTPALQRTTPRRAARCTASGERKSACSSLAALALLHAGIERVAGGIADQVDGKDRDRQQQSRPEDQRRFYLKIS